ncbi:hypothetical protein [Streptomyces sp. NPDC057580]|uniref:hypothetical protein n=1 Tax=Streptomyces sp. NPDC057580 TaxID=3346173 RepID=UPI0036B4A83E
MKNDRGRDVPLWSTLWDDSGRGGYPPVAPVFTKDVGTEARMNRIKTIRDLSRTCWQPRWQNSHGWSPRDTEEDGWWDFAGTVPVIATHLDQLRAHGPHGPVWWRFGHSDWQPITDALTNTGTQEEYHARQDRRRQEQEAARAVEDQRRREEPAQWEATWECPSCQSDVEPGTVGPDGHRPTEGVLCPACEHTRREAEREHQAAEEAARNNGILARLRARTGDR